jgi:hypothetical protein
MFDVERSANAMETLGDLVINFQDPEATESESADMNALAKELNRASDSAYKAMTEVFVVLRDQIRVEENLLKMCAQTGTLSRKKSGPSN